MRLLICAGLPAAIWICTACPALAQPEAIGRFDSHIVVHSNGVLTVTETIKVQSRGVNIRHGIYRDFPQLYRTAWGLRKKTGFSVLHVRRDGRPESYHTAPRENGTRVYIGSSARVLASGVYTYQLVYQTDHQLGFFNDHDELYWNVTGNGWIFPIEKASATVTLPDGAEPRNVKAYTGRQGAHGRDYESVITNGLALFQTTRPLAPSEGLTIVVDWPKGFVQEPTSRERWSEIVSANRGIFIALAGLLLVFVYYLVVWVVVGKDPKAGTIIPLYGPPKGFSPGAMRLLAKMGFDKRVLTAAILNLAVKGKLTIREYEDKAYTLFRTDAGLEGLTREESGLITDLFADGPRLALQQVNYQTLQSAAEGLKSRLGRTVEKTYFVRNVSYWIPGLLLTLVPLGISFFDFANSGRPGSVVAWVIGIFIVGILMNVVFYRLLKAPTLLGRRVLDQIDGFKEYLSVAEKDRLNLENPPERTPQLFERFLPYALALGVEQKWSEQFADVLASAGAGGTEYSPGWYTGNSWSLGCTSFTSSISHSLSGAISSAATAPGSGSGFGGGGGAGGGGGGGGGGGW